MNKYVLLIILVILLVIVAVILAIAQLGIEREDVVGVYYGEYPHILKTSDKFRNGIYNKGTHSLELKDDGTYVYIYTSTDGEEKKYEDRWRFDRMELGPYVYIKKINSNLLAPEGLPKAKVGVRLAVLAVPAGRLFGGRMALTVCDDLDFYLVKKQHK